MTRPVTHRQIARHHARQSATRLDLAIIAAGALSAFVTGMVVFVMQNAEWVGWAS